jgi:cytosine/adenosine deaminase-related metal-dependent hydrolase
MRGLAFINADMGPDRPDTVRVQGSQIVAVGTRAEPGDLIVDLDGDRLLPGLINAHDHLQLNSFPTPHYGRHYRNAGEWIADLNARADLASVFEVCKAIPRDQRLLQGGVKNLLSGVTTVAHHDPLYPILATADYPTQVVQTYGWSHSLGIDGEERVRDSYRQTPTGWPWIIHAAEGVDAEACAELARLDALGCLGPNTLLVHGVALDGAGYARLEAMGAGLIWCPSSNLCLFGKTAAVTDLIERGRVALGSDSRLTAARDLLDEVRAAAAVHGFDDRTLESLVTETGARLLGLTDRGVLRAGARADILILSAGLPLSKASRADVRLVMLGGSMRYGDPDYAEMMMSETQQVDVRVDGRSKRVDGRLGALLNASSWGEAGVEVPDAARSAA